MSSSEANAAPLRHVVLLRFLPDVTDEGIAGILARFESLQNTVPQIRGFELGKNISPEGLDDGFTHAAVISFESEADRDTYLNHPDHQAFAQVILKMLDKVIVCDYFTK